MMYQLEVIKLSEAHVDWKGQDKIDHGFIKGYLRGYNLEMTKEGKIDYASCTYVGGDSTLRNPEFDSTVELCGYNGWEPTGRAIFRGYYTEYYDFNEREMFVEEVLDSEIEEHLNEMEEEVYEF